MPVYEFQDAKGITHEMVYSMEDAPPIGSKVRRKGRTLTRVFSAQQKTKVWSREFTAISLQLNHPDAPRVNDKGEAVFQSDKEVREFCSKTGMEYE